MLLVALLLAFAFPEATRPDPLPDEAGCDHYKGTSSGNDPSVTFDVVLCPHEDKTAGKVEGKVQWSSLLSGWNVRKVEGQWTGDQLSMKDLEIIEERPEPGFRFCTIDPYTLSKTDDGGLEGTYDAEDCDDDATVTLAAVAAPAGANATGGAVAEPPTPREQADEPAGSKDEPTDASDASDDKPSKPSKTAQRGAEAKPSGGCGCDVTLLMAPMLGLGLARRRRRPRPARPPAR